MTSIQNKNFYELFKFCTLFFIYFDHNDINTNLFQIGGAAATVPPDSSSSNNNAGEKISTDGLTIMMQKLKEILIQVTGYVGEKFGRLVMLIIFACVMPVFPFFLVMGALYVFMKYFFYNTRKL